MSSIGNNAGEAFVAEDQKTVNGQQHSGIDDLAGHINGYGERLADANDAEEGNTKAESESKSNKWESLLLQSEIKAADEISKPPVCIAHEIKLPDEPAELSTIGTLGNFIVVIGKAKSRKTFVVTMFVAALICAKLILKCFRGFLPDNQKVVLYFDTEQGKWHVQRVLKRICRLTGIDNPENLRMFSLRPYATYDRLEAIRWAIQNIPNVGAVVIDGIRDTVFDINDAEEATNRATDLLKWTEEKHIHLITVLHENKGDRNARGHLGTEMANKCETMISVQRDQNDKEVSIITPEMCRDREFPEVRFSIDEDGLPFLIDDTNIGNFPGLKDNVKGKNTKPTPLTVERANHEAILRKVFTEGKPLSYADLRTQIRLSAEYLGIDISDRRSTDFVAWYRNEGYIKTHKPEGEKYPINEILIDRFENQPLQS